MRKQDLDPFEMLDVIKNLIELNEIVQKDDDERTAKEKVKEFAEGLKAKAENGDKAAKYTLLEIARMVIEAQAKVEEQSFERNFEDPTFH